MRLGNARGKGMRAPPGNPQAGPCLLGRLRPRMGDTFLAPHGPPPLGPRLHPAGLARTPEGRPLGWNCRRAASPPCPPAHTDALARLLADPSPAAGRGPRPGRPPAAAGRPRRRRPAGAPALPRGPVGAGHPAADRARASPSSAAARPAPAGRPAPGPGRRRSRRPAWPCCRAWRGASMAPRTRGRAGRPAPTWGVLGSGLDHPYPPSTRPLMDRIVAAGGGVITPFPPEAPAPEVALPPPQLAAGGLDRGRPGDGGPAEVRLPGHRPPRPGPGQGALGVPGVPGDPSAKGPMPSCGKARRGSAAPRRICWRTSAPSGSLDKPLPIRFHP